MPLLPVVDPLEQEGVEGVAAPGRPPRWTGGRFATARTAGSTPAA